MRRPNKYGARKTQCFSGHTHASQREANRCTILHDMQRTGEITHLEIEPQYWFEIDGAVMKHDNGRRVGYKPDFRYRDATGQLVVEDSKGFHVRDWPLRKAIFRALNPGVELREV